MIISRFIVRSMGTLGLLVCPLLAPLDLIAYGDQGDPLAIRTWPSGVVSLETHWDFEVVLDLGDSQSLPAELTQADLLITRPRDKPQELRIQLQTIPKNEVERTAQANEVVVTHWPLSEVNLYLDRVANESEQTLIANDEATFVSKNAVAITHVDERLLVLAVDGVRVALPLVERFANSEDELPIDVLVLTPVGQATAETISADAIAQAVEMKPRWGIFSAPPKPLSVQNALQPIGNTWAVSHIALEDAVENEPQDASPTQWVQLHTTPWAMPAELSELFERKELACRASQRTFAGLSVSQLNFKPANGTHTPRWNSEHMLGRELLFFSQIYAQLAPAVKVMDLNPKQMPPDYEARHPDWDGREEARQMERVSRFTRRFAYLLDGLALDEPAPGSAWTLSKLLKQMDKHYTEHTANVVKKFELADWPKK